MKLHLLAFASLLLLNSNLQAQSPTHSLFRPITSHVKDAGVYHLGLGTWTRRVEATNASTLDVIYANTCPTGYYGPEFQHEFFGDEGRIPGPNAPVVCDIGTRSTNKGCDCSYTISAFQIGYCTGLHHTVDLKIGFQSAYVACAAPMTTSSFTLNGLPGAGAMVQGCWHVTIDLDAGGQSFTMAADGASCNWLANDLPTNHLFGWTIENLTPVTNMGTSYVGPLIAFGEGWPFTPTPACSMVDGTRWDTLTCTGQGGGPAKWPSNLTEDGWGMDTQARFRDDTTTGGPVALHSGPGCFYFDNPGVSFHLRLFSNTGCGPPQPGQDFCLPSQSGVSACPCLNPGLPLHGCDNSAATGGARLTSIGAPSLSASIASSVVFTSAGEKPNATSILLQGKTPMLPQGLQFGMGVRCMYSTLKRLFVHTAASGVVTAPTAGDNTTIPAQSAALGDVIQAGETRLYLFYYRDPILLGSCSAQTLNTFNCTQGQSVLWVQ